jgi:hypothetical protein
LFPSIFRANVPVRDPWQHVADTYKLGNLYRLATGRPMRAEDRTVRGTIAKLLLSRSDTGEMSYWAALSAQHEWARREGLATGGVMRADKRSNALYLYRQALLVGDARAAARWEARYKQLGGTMRGLRDGWRRAAPETKVLQSTREFQRWYSQADQRDRDNWRHGRNWYFDRVQGTMEGMP